MRTAGSRAAGLRRSEIRVLFDAAAQAGDGCDTPRGGRAQLHHSGPCDRGRGPGGPRRPHRIRPQRRPAESAGATQRQAAPGERHRGVAGGDRGHPRRHERPLFGVPGPARSRRRGAAAHARLSQHGRDGAPAGRPAGLLSVGGRRGLPARCRRARRAGDGPHENVVRQHAGQPHRRGVPGPPHGGSGGVLRPPRPVAAVRRGVRRDGARAGLRPHRGRALRLPKGG